MDGPHRYYFGGRIEEPLPWLPVMLGAVALGIALTAVIFRVSEQFDRQLISV